MANSNYIRWFSDLGINDIPEVGGKNAALGELYQQLTKQGINVPNGFAITAQAFRYFLESNGIVPQLRKILAGIDPQNMADLERRGLACRQALLSATVPDDLAQEIVRAYATLSESCGGPRDVAVRSSATAEDLPSASFAGLHESYLNISGSTALLEACQKCFSSLFTDRAISYREEKGFDHLAIALSVGIQEMVRSDLAASGVMFSIDTETGFKNAVIINSAYGLGENIVKGVVNPDEFLVFKPTLLEGFAPIIKRRIGAKEIKMVYAEGAGATVLNLPVAPEDRLRQSLLDEEILTLARWACKIEEHFSRRAGSQTPMDIEWAKDGKTGQLYILQARPETVHAQHEALEYTEYRLEKRGKPILTGSSIGEKVAQGPARLVRDSGDLRRIQAGDVLVAQKTEPDWEPVMKKACAVVTDRGGRTCHAAIVSRELGIPAVIGTESASRVLVDGQVITVSCAEGEKGFVYQGAVPFKVQTTKLNEIPRTQTKLLINIADPAKAFQLSFLPCDGVGLTRIEFIISSLIGIHPCALLQPDKINKAEELQLIEERTKGYSDKPQSFVDKLAEGVALIGAAFYPREVIVRFSDFKTNEYSGLLGGEAFEPKEENPMLGFRGASRYYHPAYREGFGLECRALSKVRDQMGLKNVKVMIPFCRTVEEGRRVLAEMERHGLARGVNGLEVYVMCEIPSNVILAKEFAEIFDGFSIGSNDLTQLILGLDRDSEIVAPLFDERNPAVTQMIAQVVGQARRSGRKIGICGQAPSDYPEFARFLIEQKIDSISLNPDAFFKTLRIVAEAEAGTKFG